jgi:hypothetical protein
MKGRLTVFAVTMLTMLTALSFSGVTIVAANPPSRQFNQLNAFTVSGACSFDVYVDLLANKEYNTTLVDQAGNPTAIITTGVLKVSLTNLDNGKSIDLNISGPGKLVTNPDGSLTQTTHGPWLWFFSPGVLPDFSPRMFFISGQMVAQFDASGNQTGLQIIGGKPVDLCAALADP